MRLMSIGEFAVKRTEFDKGERGALDCEPLSEAWTSRRGLWVVDRPIGCIYRNSVVIIILIIEFFIELVANGSQ